MRIHNYPESIYDHAKTQLKQLEQLNVGKKAPNTRCFFLYKLKILYIMLSILYIYDEVNNMLKSHLKEYRAKFNMNQSELANRVGVTRQTIGFIEKGTISPSITLVLKLCRVFQCKVEDLFELEGIEDE